MKTIGIIIIVICFLFNVFVGASLYTKTSYYVNTSTLNSDTSKNKKHDYEKYKFSFDLDSKFKSGQSDIDNGLIDYLFINENNPFPNVQVYLKEDFVDSGMVDSKEYRALSEKDFVNSSKDFKIQYFDGGIITNLNGVKMYYDIFSALLEGNEKRTKEKMYSFFDGVNQYQIIWQDYEEDFDESVKSFDAVIDSVKFY